MILPEKIAPSVKALDALLNLLFDDRTHEPTKAAIRQIGEELHELGGIPAMHDAMMRVGEIVPEQESWRECALDRCWDGVGAWLA